MKTSLTTLAGAACAALVFLSAGDAVADDKLVIRHVTVLPMTAGTPVLKDQTVFIDGGRIVLVRDARDLKALPGSYTKARVQDGRGLYLMPALADMHVHMEEESRTRRGFGDVPIPPGALDTANIMLPFVANGVLQVMNLSSSPDTLKQKDAIESGGVLGPHIATAVMVDGDPPINPAMATVAATPEAGRKIVREIAAGGFDALKTYTNLDFDTFSAMVAEADKLHLRVLGHLPLRTKDRAADLLQKGFSAVAHTEEYGYQAPQVSEDDVPRYVELAKRTGTWLITTVKLNERVVEQTKFPEILKTRAEMRYVHPYSYFLWTNNNRYAATREQLLSRRERIVAFNRKLVKAFSDAGIPIMAGTDTLVAGVVAGFGLHDELESLAAAGVSNDKVLAAATRVPAEYLNVIDDRGTVEVGKRADLLLLGSDPLKDVAHTRDIKAVIVNGRLITRTALDGMMQRLADRYAALPPPPARFAGKTGGHYAPEDDDE